MQEQGLAPRGGVKPRSHKLCVHNTFLPRKGNTLNPREESPPPGKPSTGQAKGLQMAEICLQKAPGQDLGSQEAPRRLPEAPRRLPKAPKGSQKALKRLPARIWPKTAVSQGSQKGSLIAGRRASKWQKICLQKAPGQDLGSQEAPRSSQKAPRRLPKAPKGSQRLPEGSQKAPGQDLTQNGRFPRIPEGEFNSRPKGLQMAENLPPKGSWPGFGLPGGSQEAPRRLPEGSQKLPEGSQKILRRLPEAEFNSGSKGLEKAESCWDFICRPKGPQIAEICLQKAPGQDLAQKGGNFRACPKP